MSVLIDSDIVIEVLRGRDQNILLQWSKLAQSSLPILISPITIAEIGAGARATELSAIAAFLAPLACAPIDERVGKLAGEYLRQYGKSHGVKIADGLIAASAFQHRAELWTRNLKHYPMKGLVFYA